MNPITLIANLKKDTCGPGPWQDEPDRVVWIDNDTDLDCMIQRNHMGALCGYVGVGPDHPCHGKGYFTDEGEPDVEVHGGLTYAAACEEDGLICHVPEPDRPADIWWFGFDCAHAWDIVPHMAKVYPDLIFHDSTYKDIDYVAAEVTSLARQLKALA